MKFLHIFGRNPARDPRRRTQQQPQPDRELPADTAHKIDLIESEITAELGLGTLIPPSPQLEPAVLLEQRIEEACLLHAGKRSAEAAALLAEATATPVPSAGEQERLAWLMRLELACFDDSRQRFEDTALGYAQRFETSPPQWPSPPPDDQPAQPAPVLVVRGRLCGNTASLLAHLEKTAGRHSRVQLDLGGVNDLDIEGCRLLLDMLLRWQALHIETTFIGVDTLLELLQARFPGVCRDSDDAAWLLRIELLRAGGDKAAYEEACIAYSVMYEVSPPVALAGTPAVGRASGIVMLPREIGLPVERLLSTIAAASGSAPALALDCGQLQRIEFNAASPLLSGIARVAQGKPVEWRDTPFLVSTLLQLVGGAGQLRIINRKP